jgi:hypothetical protein
VPARRFPPPWSVEETDAYFIVRDANGQALAYVYFEEEPGRRAAAKLLTRRRGAADCRQHRQAAGAVTQATMMAIWSHRALGRGLWITVVARSVTGTTGDDPCYATTAMFVRFRQPAQRLQASLVETRRSNGKVRHEHIAGLGSIVTPSSVADRVAFWNRLHARLAKLSNRVNVDTEGKVLGAVHARIPMPTVDERRAVQLENARTDVKFWDALGNMHASIVTDHNGLIATTERTIAQSEAERAKAVERVEQAKERIARIEYGEEVTRGLGKPVTHDDLVAILLGASWSKYDMRRADQVAKPSRSAHSNEMSKRHKLSEKAAVRAVWRRQVSNA